MTKTNTRIIATVGPATSSPKMLARLFRSGVDVFRINMSHGTQEEHRQVIRRIRNIQPVQGRFPAVLVDLQGPKIRVGDLRTPRTLKKDREVVLDARLAKDTGEAIPVSYRALARDVHKGNRLLLDDGQLVLQVMRKSGSRITCLVARGGILKSHKGINLPGIKVSAASLTRKDRSDLRFALALDADYVALSFVRTAVDVRILRRLVGGEKAGTRIIAKIEKPEALDHLHNILEFSDGVMVARGDLGVEMSPEKVPVLQKQIIDAANQAGKRVITATQMLESMIENPFCTRAEANDVANAVFDGTDAVMLSGETAVGKNPVECVRTLGSIIAQAEASEYRFSTSGDLEVRPGYLPHAIAEAAFCASCETDASALVVFTLSGATALYLAKLRPQIPIVALSPNRAVCRRLSLGWGIRVALTPFGRGTDRMIQQGEEAVLRKKLVRKGETVIVVAGTTSGRGGTNMMKIHKLGE